MDVTIKVSDLILGIFAGGVMWVLFGIEDQLRELVKGIKKDEKNE